MQQAWVIICNKFVSAPGWCLPWFGEALLRCAWCAWIFLEVVGAHVCTVPMSDLVVVGGEGCCVCNFICAKITWKLMVAVALCPKCKREQQWWELGPELVWHCRGPAFNDKQFRMFEGHGEVRNVQNYWSPEPYLPNANWRVEGV